MLSKVQQFWQQTLKGFTAPTPLGPSRPSGCLPKQSRQSFDQQITLSMPVVIALRSWAQQNELTLNTIMQGAWALLLSRYSSEQDVVFGVISSDHPIPLPMRVRVNPEGCLLPWLYTLQARQGEMQQYDHPPLVQIQEWSEVPQGFPLFESFLLFESPSRSASLQDQGESWKRRYSQQHETAHYPLTVIVTAGSALSIRMLYDSTRFDDSTISRMLGHYKTILEAIAVNPTQRLADIPLLTPAEWQQVVEWNQTRADYSFEHCLHQLVEAQVERTPDAVAVEFEGEQLSYHELNRRANRLAHSLRHLGVGPDVIVGICAERSLEMLIGTLAILKAGGAYMPLDPEYPKERLAYMLHDAQVSLVLVQQRFVGMLPQKVAGVLIDNWQESDQEQQDNPVVDVAPGHLAYVIYTSGSTGQPKGSLIEHRAICNNLLWMQHNWPLHSGDRVLQKTPFTFDVSVKELFWPLLAGARLVIARPGGHRDPAYLQALILEKGITVTHFVPSMLQVFLAQPNIEACQSLRLVMCGAEALPVSLQEHFFGSLSADLLHLYGPTEATIAVTGWLCERGTQRERVPLGGPMPNVQIYVLDSYLHPVPIGVAGELHIGGVALARGYLNRPGETAERFIPNPFSQDPNARLYKTGDLARYLPDGNLEFLGRIDHQVKVRGLRVELGEIEVALNQHPLVREVIVLLREDIPGDKRLIAYVVPTQGSHDLVSELRRYLKQRLPEYMMPSAFVLLESMPLSANGKIDRQALLTAELTRPSLQQAYVAPRTLIEEQLVTIWSQILTLKQIGVHDNFFELGGDSILGIQIVARANQAGLRLTIKQIFEHQTIAELAEVVDMTPTTQAEQGQITGPVPLTPIQCWFFERDVPEAHHYNDAMLLEVRQALSPTLLERAVQELVKHHDALRLRFERKASGWRQVMAPHKEDSIFSQADLSTLPETEQISAMEAIVAELHASLNLSEGPLLRVVLFELGAHKPDRLLMLIHHLAVDGVSWRILLEDLQAAYMQLSRGEAVQLPPKTTSFKRWAERLTEYAQSTGFEQELPRWLAALGPSGSKLPKDNPGGANTVASACVVSVSLSVEETRALLQAVPVAYHTQVNDVLLTALAQAIRRWTGRETVLIDLEGHGREPIFEDVDLSRTVGWFTSIFPVQLELAGVQTPGDALKSIKEQLRHIPNRGLGYGILRYLSRNAGNVQQLRALPQPEISFNYLGQFDQALPDSSPFAWAKESIGPAYSPKGNRSHLLKINGIITEGRLQLIWEFSKDVHHQATIEQVAQDFIEALRSLISHCQSLEAGGYTPSDFPLAQLDQQVIDRLLGADRNIEDAYPLSPMQQGLLFHTLYAPHSGVYLVQLICTLHEDLNIPAFRSAWQQLLDRHPILRTALIWEGLDKPLQVVRRQIELPLEQHDWREYCAVEQQEQLEAFLQVDRAHGFKLSQAPLMRVALFHLAENTYQFIWSLHHVLLDGWCFPLILKELFAFYEADCRGENLHLEHLRPYRNYITWLEQQDLSQAEAFWKQALKGITTPTSLGFTRAIAKLPDSGQQKYLRQQTTLTTSATITLQSWAQQNNLTLNTLVQGTWALLLSHYSSEQDIVFGVTSSGRSANIPGVESMVGVFINTLPMRVQVAPDEWLLSWLKTLQAQQVEVRQFEHTPLVQIQAWSDIPRGQPLFESLFLFEANSWVDSLQSQEESWRRRDFQLREQTHYPLTVIVTAGSAISIRMLYDSTRFDDSTISRMLGHYKTMLEAIVVNPTQRLADIPLLTPAEWQQVVEWNQTRADYSFEHCLHQLVEAQVERTPGAVAVEFEGEQLSYHELNRRANRLAHSLRHLGVGPDVIVGICAERSLEMLVGALAILKAGGAYMPLDPEYPRERLVFMLHDARVSLVLTQERFVSLLPEEIAVVLIDVQGGPDQECEDNPVMDVAPGHLAYVIYTSGSTGQPKGTLIEHRAICNNLLWMQRDWPLESYDRVLQKTPFTFDVSVKELFWPLLAGARLVIARPGGHRDPAYLQEVIMQSEITVTHFVPSMLQVFLTQPGIEACRSLHLVMCGAEILPVSLQEQFFRSLSADLLHLYGPTEAAIAVTGWLCERGTQRERVPLGGPMPNVQIYVLDSFLHPVPIGIPGELYIGGVALARGYLNRPTETAEKFIPDPFSQQAGARLYKTGDLARYLPDGHLEFLGRSDHQVKLRGLRIELGEIEAALKRYSAVREGVVLAREDNPGDKHLVAYIVPNQKQPPIIHDLRTFLQNRLPKYMVPSAFVLLDALPLSPNGKVDRHALPVPDQGCFRLQDAFVAPRDPLELQLAQIWENLLGISPIGVTDNFFDLGGHSLLAVRLMAQIRAQFGRALPLSTLFQAVTIEQLAHILRQQTNSLLHSPVVALQRNGSKRPFFCIHPIGGSVFAFAALAPHLGPGQPFYALQAPGLDGEQEPYTDLEAMAAHYIDAIRAVQSQGPYLLGGWSFGGIVAFEIAQQLYEQDGDSGNVALLALLDSQVLLHDEKAETDDAALVVKFARDLGGSFATNLQVSYDAIRPLGLDDQLSYILDKVKSLNLLPSDLGVPQIRNLFQVFKANATAVLNYIPHAYPGCLTLFKASEQHLEGDQGAPMDWHELASGGVEVHMIPGNHYTMMREPHVRTLADRLKHSLNEAQEVSFRK